MHYHNIEYVHKLDGIGMTFYWRRNNVLVERHLSKVCLVHIAMNATTQPYLHEELRTVRVGSTVCHRQQKRLVMLQTEWLV